jgi:hypothetical protein
MVTGYINYRNLLDKRNARDADLFDQARSTAWDRELSFSRIREMLPCAGRRPVMSL